ncbi:MAG: SDR family NAD(P)-dependent oxidoreductase [Chloroflexales bacterium]|nr:SDR family NAD(P)-dependent oxidoreductase [Chloroflexales bacterium]
MAVARRFGRAGFQIALLARSSEQIQGYADDLARDGVGARGFAVDASSLDSLAATLAQVSSELGPPEVLVYNAVAFTVGSVSELSPEQLQVGFRVSAVGALVAAQQVLPAMRARQRGTIIFTGGSAAIFPVPDMITLSIGKAAIRMLAFGLAHELEGTGIRVGTVTIYGAVAAGTAFDPERIAGYYWDLHTRADGAGEVEISVRGD